MLDPFYSERPVFVKRPFMAAGRKWGYDQEFSWSTRGVPEETAATLYYQGFLKHDPALVVEQKVGDGLDELTLPELMNKVDELNALVRRHTTTKTNYERNKVKKVRGVGDTSRAKQIGHIRRWRNGPAAKFENM